MFFPLLRPLELLVPAPPQCLLVCGPEDSIMSGHWCRGKCSRTQKLFFPSLGYGASRAAKAMVWLYVGHVEWLCPPVMRLCDEPLGHWWVWVERVHPDPLGIGWSDSGGTAAASRSWVQPPALEIATLASRHATASDLGWGKARVWVFLGKASLPRENSLIYLLHAPDAQLTTFRSDLTLLSSDPIILNIFSPLSFWMTRSKESQGLSFLLLILQNSD